MLLYVLVACDSGGTDPASEVWNDSDGARLEATAQGLSWTRPDGAEAPLTFTLVEAYGADFDACSYDPWFLYDERAAAGTLATAGVEADQSEVCAKGFTFLESTGSADGRLQFGGGRTAVVVVDDGGPGLRLTVVPDEGELPVPWVGVSMPVADHEAFYGLGEHFDTIEHRGRVRPMQIEIELGRESGYNEVHVPVPLLVSSAGWGMLVDSHRPGVFDVAATDPGRVGVVFQQLGDGVTIDLYAPSEPALVTGRYWQRTGAPEVPPDWAFAPLHWRNVNVSGEEVLEDARTMRALDLPTGVMWVDNPWQTTYNSMQPDPDQFPNWDPMVDELHALGFRWLAWTTPYVEAEDPDHAAFSENGWLFEDQLLFSDFGDLVDLTHPDAAAAWALRVAAAHDRGIEGWKLDYGEDVQLGLLGNRLQGWGFTNGEDERTMHHRFASFYHAPYAAPQAGGGLLIGRGGGLGGHTVTDVIWPGDLDNDFERWDDEEDGTLLVGGLVSAVHGGTGLSVSGYPFYASDTGGYRGGRPTHEAFVRWMEYAALLPVWQYGGAGDNHNPWDFEAYGDSQFSDATLAAFRRYAELHTRLWPYYQAAVARMLDEGRPVVLPQGLGDPDSGVHSTLDFFVGDDLFVAPVVDAGVSTWSGTLPTGRWVHWWSGEVAQGAVTVSAAVGEGPLFQRVGSVVPLLRRSVETLAPATVDGVDSWADDPGELNARIVPGDGAHTAVADGAALTAETPDDIVLVAGSDYAGWDVEVYAPGATSAAADGVALAAGDDTCAACVIFADPWVRVRLGAGDHRLAVE